MEGDLQQRRVGAGEGGWRRRKVGCSESDNHRF